MDSGKEATIIELAEKIARNLDALEADLEKVTSRDAKKDSAVSSARPLIPNVVDEIIKILINDNEKLVSLSLRIKTEVLNKLSEH